MYQIPQWTCVLISSLCWFPASNQFFFCEHLFLYISINIRVEISLLPNPQLLEQGPHAKGLHEKLLEELPVNFSRFNVIRFKMEMHQRYALKSEYYSYDNSFWGNWCHCTDWYEITYAGRDRYSGQRTPSPSYWSDPSPRFCLLHFCLWSHSSRSHLHLPPSLAPS